VIEPETTDEMSVQCPDCGINWWLFPPATVHGSDGKLRRCIECKRIYNSDGVNVSHAEAEASVEHGSFGAAWRDYVANTEFNKLPEHDRALIRVAFVSGWRARGIANG